MFTEEQLLQAAKDFGLPVDTAPTREQEILDQLKAVGEEVKALNRIVAEQAEQIKHLKATNRLSQAIIEQRDRAIRESILEYLK